MRIDLIQPNELGPSEIAAWHSMQEATPTLANPFCRPSSLLPQVGSGKSLELPSSRMELVSRDSSHSREGDSASAYRSLGGYPHAKVLSTRQQRNGMQKNCCAAVISRFGNLII